jgi:hypothetical protein
VNAAKHPPKEIDDLEAPSILRLKIDRLKNVAPIQSEFKTKEIGLLADRREAAREGIVIHEPPAQAFNSGVIEP